MRTRNLSAQIYEKMLLLLMEDEKLDQRTLQENSVMLKGMDGDTNCSPCWMRSGKTRQIMGISETSDPARFERGLRKVPAYASPA